jgi:hypothetical protein
MASQLAPCKHSFALDEKLGERKSFTGGRGTVKHRSLEEAIQEMVSFL